jgi:hemolysin III
MALEGFSPGVEGMTSSTYSAREEWLNCAVHVGGVVASLIALPALVLAAHRTGDPWLLAGGLVFGLSALLMFSTSALYHAAKNPQTRLRLRRFDHVAIYLLIAGTYTPLTLGALRGSWGWSLTAVIWSLALLGVIFKTTSLGFRFHRTSVALYVAMGWLAVVAAKPLMQHLSTLELSWLVAGGLCYTGGVAFYLWKSRPYTHAIWHVFVFAGVACHFVTVLSVTSG